MTVVKRSGADTKCYCSFCFIFTFVKGYYSVNPFSFKYLNKTDQNSRVSKQVSTLEKEMDFQEKVTKN